MNKIRILNLHNCQNRNQEDLKQCYHCYQQLTLTIKMKQINYVSI
jgi:hypothetical protein